MITIAIRVWHWPHWAMYVPGGSLGQPRVGEADPIEETRQEIFRMLFWYSASSNILLIIYLLGGIAALALLTLARSFKSKRTSTRKWSV